MHRTTARMLLACTLSAAASRPAAAAMKKLEHPFMLWDRQELAALRERIRSDGHAKEAFQRLLAEAADRGAAGRKAQQLLHFAVTGDPQLAEAQKKELLRVLKSPIPRGGAQWLTVLRYDLLYDRLTASERAAFEDMARTYIRNAIFENAVFDPKIFNDSARYSRYDARKYTRANWLPNIIWPRKISANLLAVALRDEGLIRKTWGHYGSWKWYFDEYLCDDGFYSEEFSKMGATPGAMLLYCLAVERLGLGELGFGYRGRGGATLRGHIRSLIHLGYPRVDVGGERPQYPMVTMGDLRQSGSSQAHNLPSPAFQHSIVGGYIRLRGADGAAEWFGGNLRWRAHGAWGGEIRGRNPQWDGYGGFTPKMQLPLWFELAARRWPEDGCAYFLAQMRPPGDELYIPSLWFGLGAIDPKAARPPAAPSAVWPQRGIIMLRAEESPAYWESPAPAVAMRTASNYAHNVRDAFALLGYYAFNRPIYLNRQVTPGYATGWSRSIQSHCGVTVDGAEPKFTDATTTRHAFAEDVKFAAAASRDVYEGVELTRSLLLTREYLLDVMRLAGQKPHDCAWIIHALGELRDDGAAWQAAEGPKGLLPLKKVRRRDAGDGPWSVTADQLCALEDPSQAKLPKSWYDRRIGVRISMLGEPGTAVYAAQTPLPLIQKREGSERKTVEQPSEVGGVTLIVTRRASSTTFAALHEPFRRGTGRGLALRAVAQNDAGLAVAVEGAGVNDRLMLRLAGDVKQPLTLAGGGESFTFSDYAFIRIAADGIRATSRELTALNLEVGTAKPALLLNGRPAPGRFAAGRLSFGKDGRSTVRQRESAGAKGEAMKGWLAKPSQTEPHILAWAKAHPRLVRLRTRKTFTGQTAYAVTITDAEARGAKKRLLVAQPHAHEPATTAGMMNFIARLLTGSGLDGEPAKLDRRRILREAEVTFIPDGNPSGRAKAPVDFWDGSKYTNDAFLKIAFGTAAGGARFPRQGRWSLTDQQPATIGIVYEQISKSEFVEPNRDRDSTYFKLLRAALDEGGAGRFLSLHQTEFEKSKHNAMIILPFMQAELPQGIRACNERWGLAVIEAWRAAGAEPMPKPRPLGYGEDQIRYFRACWSGIYRAVPTVTVEVQNNSPRTPPAMQRRLMEIAIQTTIELLLAEKD